MSDSTTDAVPEQPLPGTLPEGFDPDDHGDPLPVPEDVEPPRVFTNTASPEGPFSATETTVGTVDGFSLNYGDTVRFLPLPIAKAFAEFILNE
jgi:hypothetical protein